MNTNSFAQSRFLWTAAALSVCAWSSPLHAQSPAAPQAPPPEEELKVGGYVQAQYQHNDLSKNQLQTGGTPLNQDQFLVRRGRLRLDRAWELAAVSLELDANTGRGPRVGIRRAEASLLYRGGNAPKLPPLVMLSAGVMDIPFGFELNESARSRWFMERSQGSLAIYPTDPDVGVKLSGAVSVLRYALALQNGEPVDDRGFPRDPNSGKDVLGRLRAETKLGSQLELGGGASFVVGRGFHAGKDAKAPSVSWNDENQDDLVQAEELVGVAGSAATPSKSFDRWATGVELGAALKTAFGRSQLYGEAFLAKNFDRGYVVSDPVGSGADAYQAGAYLALTQELTRYGVAAFRASFYDPSSDVIGDAPTAAQQSVTTLSPLIGVVLPEHARLLLQYDFVLDHSLRDAAGNTGDADNDQWVLRLQADL